MANQSLELQRADYQCGQFVTSLLASQAESTLMDGRDSLTVIPIHVSRQEVLDCFLRRNPQFEPFRERLAETFKELTEFPLNQERWETVSKST